VLNIAPNSYIQIVRRPYKLFSWCDVLQLTSSPQVFLHYYSTRPSHLVGWLSLVNQLCICFFAPYTLSYKNFKGGLFKVVVELLGCRFFYDGDKSKFPIY